MRRGLQMRSDPPMFLVDRAGDLGKPIGDVGVAGFVLLNERFFRAKGSGKSTGNLRGPRRVEPTTGESLRCLPRTCSSKELVMATTTSGLNQPMPDLSAQLRAQIHDGVRDASDELSHLAKEAADSGKLLYDAGHDRLRAEVENLKAALAKLGDQAVRQGEVSLHAVTDVVAARPLLSLCGAFAAGVAISLLIGGRRAS